MEWKTFNEWCVLKERNLENTEKCEDFFLQIRKVLHQILIIIAFFNFSHPIFSFVNRLKLTFVYII